MKVDKGSSWNHTHPYFQWFCDLLGNLSPSAGKPHPGSVTVGEAAEHKSLGR